MTRNEVLIVFGFLAVSGVIQLIGLYMICRDFRASTRHTHKGPGPAKAAIHELTQTIDPNKLYRHPLHIDP